MYDPNDENMYECETCGKTFEFADDENVILEWCTECHANQLFILTEEE